MFRRYLGDEAHRNEDILNTKMYTGVLCFIALCFIVFGGCCAFLPIEGLLATLRCQMMVSIF